MFSYFLLYAVYLSLHLADFGGLFDLLSLEGLQQVMHVLPDFIFDLVPLKLRYLYGLFFCFRVHNSYQIIAA